jgi:hypothetical protein
MRQDGMHIGALPVTSGGTDVYTYEVGTGKHAYFSNLYDDELVIPNRIVVVDTEPPNSTGATKLTGTVTFTNSSTAITGAGTAFTTECSASGGHIQKSGGTAWYKIASIESDTALTLSTAFAETGGADTVDSTLYGAWFEGSATDTNSYALLGYYATRVYIEDNCTSDADATMFAEAYLSGIQRMVSRGIINAPMNCGQELYDYVNVVSLRY